MQIEFRSWEGPFGGGSSATQNICSGSALQLLGALCLPGQGRLTLPDFYGKHTSAANNNNAEASLEFFFRVSRLCGPKRKYIYLLLAMTLVRGCAAVCHRGVRVGPGAVIKAQCDNC